MESDGCTSWLDGIPTWLGGTGKEWLHCCVAHDQPYYTDAVTQVVHDTLASCVSQTEGGMLMAACMWVGVTGWWYLTRRQNKKDKRK